MQQNMYIPAAKGAFSAVKVPEIHQFPSHGYDFYFCFFLYFKYETQRSHQSTGICRRWYINYSLICLDPIEATQIF